MAKHYRQNKNNGMRKSKGKSDAMMMPRDAANDQNMSYETKMNSMGKSYYGPGYGHASNLPPYPDMKYYPKAASYLRTGEYPDTITEIDSDGKDNIANLNRQLSDDMY